MTKEAKKVPKFVNFDAEMIHEQMLAVLAHANAQKMKKNENEESDEDFMQELNQDFDDGTCKSRQKSITYSPLNFNMHI